jgi:hypothetical protein
MPAMTMELQMSADPLRNEFVYELLAGVRMVRRALLPAIGACLLLFAVCGVYLCCAAGRKPKTEELRAGGLNRIPLDLYLAGGGFGIVGLVAAAVYGSEYFARSDEQLAILFCGACAYIACLLLVSFFFAFVAQVKTPGGFWWRHSLCGRVLKLGWKLFKKAWVYVAKFFRRIAGYIHDVFALLPVMWEWILVGGVLGLILVIICESSTSHWYTVFPMFLWCLVFAALVIYCGYCYGTIYKGIRRMRAGDLNEKIDTRWMYGAFRKIGYNRYAYVLRCAPMCI